MEVINIDRFVKEQQKDVDFPVIEAQKFLNIRDKYFAYSKRLTNATKNKDMEKSHFPGGKLAAIKMKGKENNEKYKTVASNHTQHKDEIR